MKTIIIKGKEYTPKYSLRALFLYERMTGRNGFDPRGVEDTFRFMFAMIKSGTRDCDLTWDEFIDACDTEKGLVDKLGTLFADESEYTDDIPEAEDGGSETEAKKN